MSLLNLIQNVELRNILRKPQVRDSYKIVQSLHNPDVDIRTEEDKLRCQVDQRKAAENLKNELRGIGPIDSLLLEKDVSEVMVNGHDQVYCERKGKLELSSVQFRDNSHVIRTIESILALLGQRIDQNNPIVDARLSDGIRVNAMIPPLAQNGPTLTIRKYSKDPLKAQDLIELGTMSEENAVFLEACVKARLNIIVSGGLGTGKTTTLNVLSSFIPGNERIVSIEETSEIKLWNEQVVSLESQPSSKEGKSVLSTRNLFRNSQRLKLDRVIVGDIRGGEVLEMLQAMKKGQDGFLAAGYSNSPRDMITQLETLVFLAGTGFRVSTIRKQIAEALDLIIQQTRLKDGSRKITKITEVQGMVGDNIVLQDIFTYKQEGVNSEGKIIGRLVPTGARPKFNKRLESSHI